MPVMPYRPSALDMHMQVNAAYTLFLPQILHKFSANMKHLVSIIRGVVFAKPSEY